MYWQDIASKAYATEYANGQLKEEGAGHGISKVEIAGTGADAQAIYEWLSDYTRYDNTFPLFQRHCPAVWTTPPPG